MINNLNNETNKQRPNKYKIDQLKMAIHNCNSIISDLRRKREKLKKK